MNESMLFQLSNENLAPERFSNLPKATKLNNRRGSEDRYHVLPDCSLVITLCMQLLPYLTQSCPMATHFPDFLPVLQTFLWGRACLFFFFSTKTLLCPGKLPLLYSQCLQLEYG